MKGKTVVVTGAARGIGKATADLFASQGFTVARLDIEPLDGETRVDVSDEKAVATAFAGIGKIDVLVNNAGIAVRKNALEISREEWDRVLDVNVDGLFFCSQAAARRMKWSGGGGGGDFAPL